MALHRRQCRNLDLLFSLAVVFSVSCTTMAANGDDEGPGLSDPLLEIDETQRAWPDEDERLQRVEALLADPLQMDEAVEVGLLNNPGLQGALRQVDVRGATLRQQAAIANPEFHSELYIFDEQWGFYRVESSLELDLTSLLSRASRLRAATSGVDASRARTAGEVLDFTTDVRRAWIETVSARQYFEHQKLLYQGATAAAESARAYYDAGNMADDELSRVLAATAEAKRHLFEAEDAYWTLREELALLLGLSPDDEWSLPAELDEPPRELDSAEPVEDLALEQNLRLHELSLDEEHQSALTTASRWQGWVPELRLGVVADWRGGDLQAGPTIGLGIPVFDRRRFERDALQARTVQLDFERRQQSNRIRILSARADRRLRHTYEIARHFRDEILPLREEVVEQSLRHYNAMTIGVFDLLDARHDHLKAEGDYIEALRDFWLARVDVDHLLAGGSPDDDTPRTGRAR